ncbi:hypothetical protein QA640_32980 [Bradyrhizobium sp. CB82]|uniref:hypothetical protein n=1 Tax=Bradyrhizobium sp. CB82 TaxID=3039159 RepID=UPI0024B04B07|nr:hypothetical protein [Bradyrhizobium sp. CB82]WFU39160.1 hypothetical protein QA640_32980 [Bradyrhizobium sp. CB82]
MKQRALATDETNEHVFDPGRHSGFRVNEYGDTQRSCSSRASCKRSVAMSRTSILNRSIRTAAAAVVFAGLLSPANAAYQQDAMSVFPNLPVSAGHTKADAPVARNLSAVPTSRLPWLAPVGHRQPQKADAPQSEAVSACEREQQQFDQELDRKLIICKGCGLLRGDHSRAE